MNFSRIDKHCANFDFCFSLHSQDAFIANDLYSIALNVGYYPYLYSIELGNQSGMMINEIAENLYQSRPTVIVAGSKYGKTIKTELELSHIFSYVSQHDDGRAIIVQTAPAANVENDLAELITLNEKVRVIDIGNEITTARNRFQRLLSNGFLKR